MEVSERIERIKREQEEMRWSVANLSDASGVHRTTIYRIYKGEVTPDTDTLEHLEDALGISDIPAVEAKIISQKESVAISNVQMLNEKRIRQMRAHYNREAAELKRAIIALFFLCVAQTAIIAFLAFLIESPL